MGTTRHRVTLYKTLRFEYNTKYYNNNILHAIHPFFVHEILIFEIFLSVVIYKFHLYKSNLYKHNIISIVCLSLSCNYKFYLYN